jgi:hypothetical protein
VTEAAAEAAPPTPETASPATERKDAPENAGTENQPPVTDQG